MAVRTLLAKYGLLQARIEALLAVADTAVADLSLLFTAERTLRTKIVSARPDDPGEAAEQIACLANLLRRELRRTGAGGEVGDLAEALLECGASLSMSRATVTAPEAGPSGAPAAAARTFGGSLAEYVSFAEGRVSIIDTACRYVATSPANAAFYDCAPVTVMGAHVADLIGGARFERRARARFDACFAGIAQSYHHALPAPDQTDARVMRCDMKPVRSSEGVVIGALVYMTDVTDRVRRLRGTGPVVAPAPLERRS